MHPIELRSLCIYLCLYLSSVVLLKVQHSLRANVHLHYRDVVISVHRDSFYPE